jgi:hypothetical protein
VKLKTTIQISLALMLLAIAACNKGTNTESQSKSSGTELQNPEQTKKEELAKKVDNSKKQAAVRFPQLVELGSEFKIEFEKRAAQLEESQSAELNDSDWPLKLANKISSDLSRKQQVEDSKKQAVIQFPDLGKAGSEFNKKFVEGYNQLRESNSPKLESPQWPFALATQISQELRESRQQALDKELLFKNFPDLKVPGSEMSTEFQRREKELIDNKSPLMDQFGWRQQLASEVFNELDSKRQFNESQKRACVEFPELNIVGSEILEEYQTKVKLLKLANDPLLKNPQWPYFLAQQIAQRLYNPNRTYSIDELSKLKVLPVKVIQIQGTVTSVDCSLSEPSGQIVLEKRIQCEFKLLASADSGLHLVKKPDAVAAQYLDKRGKVSSEWDIFRVGRECVLKGRVVQRPDGKILFKAEASDPHGFGTNLRS